MAHFYASINGTARTTATRCGSKNSGINGHIRGWSVGVKVYGFHDETTGGDVFEVWSTGGSNDGAARELLAVVGRDKK